MGPQPVDLGTLEPQQQEVTIGGVLYIVCEASEASEVEYRNANSRAAKYDEAGKRVSFEALHDGEPILAGMNIYEANPKTGLFKHVDADGDPVPVGVPVVKVWKASLVRRIFDMVYAMSPTVNGEFFKEKEKTLPEGEKGERPTPATEATSA